MSPKNTGPPDVPNMAPENGPLEMEMRFLLKGGSMLVFGKVSISQPTFFGGKLFQPVILFKQAKAQQEAKQAGEKSAYTPGSTNIAMENPPF